jgi:outer membrane protein OmpA-like peptidoglycan-associated protein
VKSAWVVAALGALAGPAAADPTGGVDSALFRNSYDANGVFALEGARLMPVHDLSFKLTLGYGSTPVQAAVPGIGTPDGKDKILDYLGTLDMAFGITLGSRIAIGFDVAGYRTATGDGYGVRGHYSTGGHTTPSTGLISLRPLSNIDPSANPDDHTAYLGDGLAGPLDARVGVKVALYSDQNIALTAVGSLFVPFGEDQMLLGDENLVFEPKLAFEWRPDRVHATRVLANAAMRIRERTVLEGYDPTTQTDRDALAFLDVGSEAVVGAGAVLEFAPRVYGAAEVQAFLPLPDSLTWGTCRLNSGERCSSLTSADYAPGAKHGDFVFQGTAGLMFRATADLTAEIMVGTDDGGARGEAIRGLVGIVWAPQPAGAAAPGKNDKDGDGVPDGQDACPDDPEDKDGFQDEDGCPDPDNDGDGIPDAKDQCPNEPEDKDGFQDEDGCPDPDNDGDGIPDAIDKCPNEPEDKDGFQDEDGCPDPDNDNDGVPDVADKCPNDPRTGTGPEDADGCPHAHGMAGPEERADRIDLKGQPITFVRNTATLTPAAKATLAQVATVIKAHKLAIRVEVHVPLGTRATGAGAIAAQKRRDKALSQARAKSILEALTAQGVPAPQLQGVGIGSERPFGTSPPTDPVNDRVDFIKAQQGGAP